YGTITVQSGTLQLSQRPSSWLNAGTITAASGTELDINGSFTQAAAGSLTADQVVIHIDGYNYGTTAFAGSYSANATSVSSDHITTAVFSGDATHGATPRVGALSISNAAVDFSPLVPETVTLASLSASNSSLGGADNFVV